MVHNGSPMFLNWYIMEAQRQLGVLKGGRKVCDITKKYQGLKCDSKAKQAANKKVFNDTGGGEGNISQFGEIREKSLQASPTCL